MTAAEALRALEAREARILLAHAWGVPHATLLAYPERTLPEDVEASFARMCARRSSGEPVAYIVGTKEFYGLDLEVNASVLVPRPETELLVELALERRPARVADLGTGSGAIALAIKKHRPAARVVAVEASAAALEVAERNALRHGVEVDFRHGRWFEPLAGETFALLVSNPPYVGVGDPHLAELRFEPREALLAGPQGLDALREIAVGAAAHLAPGGWVLLEHGQGQERAVQGFLDAAGLEEVRTWPDLAGIGRVTGARR